MMNFISRITAGESGFEERDGLVVVEQFSVGG